MNFRRAGFWTLDRLKGGRVKSHLIEYIDSQSLRLDFEILVRTLKRVVQRDGISQEGHATMPEFLGSHE